MTKNIFFYKAAALLLAVLLLATTVFIAPFTFAFSGSGDGDQSSPYIITNCEELQEMNDDLSAWYELGNDIDCSMTNPADDTFDSEGTWGDETGWIPVSTGVGSGFYGRFNGNGYTISGLFINRPNNGYQGLFSYVWGAVIENVSLTEVNITGRSDVGALAGGGGGGSQITNVFASGEVAGNASDNGNRIGGLFGELEDKSLVLQSGADVVVSGIGRVGGLVGRARDNVRIISSYALGDVSGTGSNIGGLVGQIEYRSLIANSYAQGDVSGGANQYIGGLVGSAYSSFIANVYASGEVTSAAEASGVGGLFGYNGYTDADYFLTGAFWNGEVNDELNAIGLGNTTGVIGIVGLSTAQLQNQTNFTNMGWDFAHTWQISGGEFPTLRTANIPFVGDGTEASPYLIGDNCALLANLRFYPNAHVRLTDNVDCTMTEDWHEGAGFMSLSYADSEYRFKGVFDGDDHIIDGVYINTPSTNFVGLFRLIDDGAEVKNLGVTNADITGGSYIGALSGILIGTAENVYVTGEVEGDSAVGGLVGIHGNMSGVDNSSPLVFTWNGEEYTYVADVGQMITRGTDGTDQAIIERTDLVAKDDVYSIKISQEYNEIVYYDELALMLFEHQPGYTVVEPLLRNTTFADLTTVSDTPTHPLQMCTDMYGNDCVEALSANDDKWSYRDASEVNHWIMGFGDLSDAPRVQLVLRAARDYSVKPEYDYRTVSVIGEDGEWVQIYGRKELGSDGTPRLRTIDLTGKFLTDDYRIKLGFDRLSVNYVAIDTAPEVPFTVQTVHPSKAELSFRGYTTIDRTHYVQHDYNTVSAFTPEVFATQSGYFTRYGDVLPLLQSTDDQFVIMRHGDHMDIEFPVIPVTDGMERSYILFNQIVYKHANDPTGKTVDPLPYQGMTAYPSDGYPMTSENAEYLKTWNTRYYSGTTDQSQTIINSYSSVNVTGSGEVAGGLVGINEKAIIRSYATGDVAGDGGAGGLVGLNDEEGTIEDSYATGNVRANSFVAGFVAVNKGAISRSFSTGLVEGEDSGGFAAVTEGESGTGNFWDTVSSDQVTSSEGEGRTTDQMKELNTFADSSWDIQSSGSTDLNNGYPFLSWQNVGGSMESVWLISVAEEVVETPQKPSTSSRSSSGSGSVQHQVAILEAQGNTDEANKLRDRWAHLFDNETSSQTGVDGSPEAKLQSLQSQLQALLEMYREITGRDFTPSSVTPESADVFVRDLQRDMEGEDVRLLQQLLNQNGYQLATLGVGSPGNETSYFGSLTQQALIRYQQENNISPTAGYFGPITRAVMKAAELMGVWW